MPRRCPPVETLMVRRFLSGFIQLYHCRLGRESGAILHFPSVKSIDEAPAGACSCLLGIRKLFPLQVNAIGLNSCFVNLSADLDLRRLQGAASDSVFMHGWKVGRASQEARPTFQSCLGDCNGNGLLKQTANIDCV